MSNCGLRLVLCVLVAWTSLACGAGSHKGATAGASSTNASTSTMLELESPPGDAKSRMQEAIDAMDGGKLPQAVALLEQLKNQFPDNGVILHELGLAYRLSGQPKKAVALLAKFRERLPAVLLSGYGSALDEAGDRKGAESVFRDGIKNFPDSGLLRSELGTLLANTGRVPEALEQYEIGMRVSPDLPANYFNAAALLADSHRRGMSLIYAEIFRVLEPNSKRSYRTAESMVKICRDAVQVEIKNGETSAKVSLASNEIKIKEGADNAQLPFENRFELVFGLDLVIANSKGLTLASLHEARKHFLAQVDETKATMKLDTHPLIRWLLALNAAGHLEAYDFWLFGPGFPDETKAWTGRDGAEQRLENLSQYINSHPLFSEGIAKPSTKI
jgi:tetratricopeptide (TPR) repeat protein